MYKCKHFALHELVPKHILAKRGEKAWELLNPLMLITLDRLWERFGTTYMNNYHWGGIKQWQGLRTPESPDYSDTSQHSYGNAGDLSFKNYAAEQIRQDIIDNPEHECYEHITSIESGIDWFHFDVRNCERIKYFYPRD